MIVWFQQAQFSQSRHRCLAFLLQLARHPISTLHRRNDLHIEQKKKLKLTGHLRIARAFHIADPLLCLAALKFLLARERQGNQSLKRLVGGPELLMRPGALARQVWLHQVLLAAL
jgi:hypothetical protein